MTEQHGRLCENEPGLAQVPAGKNLKQKHNKTRGRSLQEVLDQGSQPPGLSQRREQAKICTLVGTHSPTDHCHGSGSTVMLNIQ